MGADCPTSPSRRSIASDRQEARRRTPLPFSTVNDSLDKESRRSPSSDPMRSGPAASYLTARRPDRLAIVLEETGGRRTPFPPGMPSNVVLFPMKEPCRRPRLRSRWKRHTGPAGSRRPGREERSGDCLLRSARSWRGRMIACTKRPPTAASLFSCFLRRDPS
jgi:hypothetical protein